MAADGSVVLVNTQPSGGSVLGCEAVGPAGGSAGPATAPGPASAHHPAYLADPVLRPMGMLVLEDLHWADPDTLDVLSYLADAAGSPQVVVVATAWDEFDPPQPLLDLAQASQADVIPLDRLGSREIRTLAESCLTGQPADELIGFVVEHDDGLPFLLEELLTGLAAGRRADPDCSLTGPLTTDVPRTFAAAVRRRLTGLDRSARSVVEAAAVLGRRFDWRLIPEITGLEEPVVLSGLRSTVATGLVVVDDPDTDTFRFRHALTCDAVRTDLLPREHRGASPGRRAVPVRRLAGPPAQRAHTRDAQLSRAAALSADKPALCRETKAVLVEVEGCK